MAAKPHDNSERSSRSDRAIYYFDIVHDYPSMGGVVEFSQILFKQLRQHYDRRLVSVRDMAAKIGCAYPDMLYLDRERKVAEVLTAVDPKSVFFFPNFQSPVARRPADNGPSIVNVVHDVQFAFLPELFSEARRRWLHQTFVETKQNADQVVFISRSTQRDYVRLFGKPRRYAVIYNPIEAGEATGSAARPADEERPFLLASFHHHPHKNFSGLLSLFVILAERMPNLELAVTGHGRERFDADLVTLSATVRSRIQHRGYVPRLELDELYRRAQAFITLSRFEGFNMSAAEAACHGTPLILSDLPVHRELFGEQACFIDLATPPTQSAEKVAAYLKDGPRRKRWPLRDVCSPSRVRSSYVRVIDSCSA